MRKKRKHLNISLKKTAEVAQHATCERSKCGSVIVQLDEIIGSGFNSPPQDIEEQMGIMDAVRRNSDVLSGSKLYFVRLDDKLITNRFFVCLLPMRQFL